MSLYFSLTVVMDVKALLTKRQTEKQQQNGGRRKKEEREKKIWNYGGRESRRERNGEATEMYEQAQCSGPVYEYR